MRRTTWLAAAFFAFTPVITASAQSMSQPVRLAAMTQADYIGKPAPDFDLPDMQGKSRKGSEWKGDVVVVNFWATWCAPCKKEIPIFNDVQAEYETQGVTFLGIALDDDKAVQRFMEIIPIDYTVLIGDMDAAKLSQQFGNVAGVLPFTAFLDRRGRIASIAAGGLTEQVTRDAIEKLL